MPSNVQSLDPRIFCQILVVFDRLLELFSVQLDCSTPSQVSADSTRSSRILTRTQVLSLQRLVLMLFHFGCSAPDVSWLRSASERRQLAQAWTVPRKHLRHHRDHWYLTLPLNHERRTQRQRWASPWPRFFSYLINGFAGVRRSSERSRSVAWDRKA